LEADSVLNERLRHGWMLAELELYERPARFCACGRTGALTIAPLDTLSASNRTAKNRAGLSKRCRKSSVNIEAGSSICGVINYLISVVSERWIRAARKSGGHTWERAL